MSAIAIRNLIYDVPQKRILDNINLEIERGEIVSIMGQSGSGKTTLLKILSGLRKPTSGEVLIEGEDIAQLSEAKLDAIRLKMGLVFQYAALFDSLTVYENIIFSVVRHHKRKKKSELDALVKNLLEQVKLPGIENLYPSQLSGGMQKRVGLARALAMEPLIVCYDEPTSGLDPLLARAIDDMIVETNERFGVTSIVVSHHLPSIFRISDRVAMLHQGEIVLYGTPDELRSSTHPAVQAFVQAEAANRR